MSTKTITYDRDTQDFLMTLDGDFVGYAATRDAAERILDDLVYERLRRQQPDPTDAQRDAAPEPTPAPAAVARIAEPSIIADASSVIYALAALLPEREREAHYRAIAKAVGQLMEGVVPVRDGAAMVFPSRTRKQVEHRVVEGVCSCEATGYCWHLAAAKLVDLIEEARNEDARVDAEYDERYCWAA